MKGTWNGASAVLPEHISWKTREAEAASSNRKHSLRGSSEGATSSSEPELSKHPASRLCVYDFLFLEGRITHQPFQVAPSYPSFL